MVNSDDKPAQHASTDAVRMLNSIRADAADHVPVASYTAGSAPPVTASTDSATSSANAATMIAPATPSAAPIAIVTAGSAPPATAATVIAPATNSAAPSATATTGSASPVTASTDPALPSTTAATVIAPATDSAAPSATATAGSARPAASAPIASAMAISGCAPVAEVGDSPSEKPSRTRKRLGGEVDLPSDASDDSARVRKKAKNRKKRAKAKAKKGKVEQPATAASASIAAAATTPASAASSTSESTPTASTAAIASTATAPASVATSTTQPTPTLPTPPGRTVAVASTATTPTSAATSASPSAKPRPGGKQPRPAGKQPRPVGKQPSSPVDSDDEDECESDDSDEDVRTENPWKKKRRKWLFQHNLPKGHEKIEAIVDYKIDLKTKDVGMCKVVYFKDKKTDWVHRRDVDYFELFQDDIDAIRKWKRTTVPTFKQFLTTPAGAKYAKKKQKSLGADDDVACGYRAVGIVFELLGLSNPVSKSSIEEFRAIGAKRRKLSPEEYAKKGVVWQALGKFIGQLGLVDMGVINKNLYCGHGAGVDGLEQLRLSDGVYIVGGWSTERIGHCFVMEVTCGHRRVCSRRRQS